MKRATRISDYKSALSAVFGAVLGGWMQKYRLEPDAAERIRQEARLFVEAIAPSTGMHPDVVKHLYATLEKLLGNLDVYLSAIEDGMKRFGENPADLKEAYNGAIVLAKKCQIKIAKRRK
jgi:hypothetical protein